MNKVKNLITESCGHFRRYIASMANSNIFLGILAVIFVALIIVCMVGVVVGITALVAALPALIIWALYNYVLASAFTWPHLNFWTILALVWVAGIIGNLFLKR